MSATGTALLLKFELFQQVCLENYIKSVYHSNYTENTKTIKSGLKSERKKNISLKKKIIRDHRRKCKEQI